MNFLLKEITFKKEKKETDFARFFRTAKASDRKKVFLKVAKKATEDQRKIMGYTN